MLKNNRWTFKLIFICLFMTFWIIYPISQGHTASTTEINAKVDGTLKEFYSQVGAGEILADKAEGILVFPSVLKAGFWIGGQYGQGALRIDGETVDYYNIVGASFGIQFGAQAKSVIIFFMTEKALFNFRNSHGWEAGVDGSVAIATLGTGGSLDTHTLQQPIIGFVFDNKGLMVDISLKGSKITKIDK